MTDTRIECDGRDGDCDKLLAKVRGDHVEIVQNHFHERHVTRISIRTLLESLRKRTVC